MYVPERYWNEVVFSYRVLYAILLININIKIGVLTSTGHRKSCLSVLLLCYLVILCSTPHRWDRSMSRWCHR